MKKGLSQAREKIQGRGGPGLGKGTEVWSKGQSQGGDIKRTSIQESSGRWVRRGLSRGVMLSQRD